MESRAKAVLRLEGGEKTFPGKKKTHFPSQMCAVNKKNMPRRGHGGRVRDLPSCKIVAGREEKWDGKRKMVSSVLHLYKR